VRLVILYSSSRNYLDLANACTLLDNLCDVLEGGELVLVGGLLEVADLGDVLGRLEGERVLME